MHTHPQFRSFALFHKALGNERRVYMLLLLVKHGVLTGAALVAKLSVHPPAVSRHLHVLLKAGLAEGKRTGKEVEFSAVRNAQTMPLLQEIQQLHFSQKG